MLHSRAFKNQLAFVTYPYKLLHGWGIKHYKENLKLIIRKHHCEDRYRFALGKMNLDKNNVTHGLLERTFTISWLTGGVSLTYYAVPCQRNLGCLPATTLIHIYTYTQRIHVKKLASWALECCLLAKLFVYLVRVRMIWVWRYWFRRLRVRRIRVGLLRLRGFPPLWNILSN